MLWTLARGSIPMSQIACVLGAKPLHLKSRKQKAPWLRLVRVIFNSVIYRTNLSPWRHVACWAILIVANTYAMLFAWRYSRIPAAQKMRFGLPARIGR
jgi:hypothetical protein